MDVSTERELDGRLVVKIQTDTLEMNVRATSNELTSLGEIRAAIWSERRSLAVGESAGAPVFWSAVDGHAAVMIGHDDDTWDISVALPLAVVDEIVRQAVAQR